MKKLEFVKIAAKATLNSTKRMFSSAAIGPRSGYISGDRPLPKALQNNTDKKLSEEK